MLAPLQYLGEGQFQAPKGHAKRCDRDLVIGETLQWEVHRERSAESHRHYFAVIADAWGNLPEVLAADFPSPEHLRKHALIKAGYCTVNRLVFPDNAEAIRAAAFLQSLDTYAICEVSGRVVTVYRAKSQSIKAMGKATFQKSKDDVFTAISQIIGADATQAGMAA